jgi:hypothetical protein
VITVDEESEFVRVRKRNWARLIARVWKDDPEVCPECGSRTKIKTRLVTPGWNDALYVQSVNNRASPGVAHRRAAPGDARNDLIVESVC